MTARLMVVVTCGVAAVCFAGAVTERALFGFVLPGLVLGGAVTAVFAAHRQLRAAMIAGLAIALVWAEIANVMTGQGNGPAARSSFAAAGLTALAVTAAAWRLPALFLAPVGGIVVAAALLGAGGEVRVVAMVTVGVAVVALASVESAHRAWVRPIGGPRPTRRWSVGALALLVMLAAALAAVTQARHDPRAPHAAVAGSHNSLVKPPWQDPFPATKTPGQASDNTAALPRVPSLQPGHHRHPHRQHQPVRSPRASSAPQVTHHNKTLEIALLVSLGLLVLLILAIGVRLAMVGSAWRRIRRRLHSAAPEGVVGAWVWARLRFRAYELPLPAQLSPDLVDRGESIHEVPPRTAQPLGELARLVTPAAFAPAAAVAEADVEAAWRLSDAACAAAEDSLSRFAHVRLRVASPPRKLGSNG